MDAVFWVASGESFIKEAQASALTVAGQMPGLRLYLFTPDPVNPPEFYATIRLSARASELWFLDCVNYLRFALDYFRPGDRLVFLDTDTVAILPFPELFALSPRFDLAGAHAPGRITTATTQYVPASFPELNVGVMLFTVSDNLRAFVTDWYLRFELGQAVYGNNDQGPLREALWNAPRDFQYYVFPSEWNTRPFGSFLCGPSRIFHGRVKNILEVARSANKEQGMRLWKPGSSS